MRKVIGLILLFTIAAFGTDWWVDTRSGDDANDGTTIGTPEATIGAGMVDATAGDTVYVYTNGITNAATELVTFANASDEGVVLMRWPDSTQYIYINGEGARICITIEAGCNSSNELFPEVHNVVAYNGLGAGTGCVNVAGGYPWFVSCSLNGIQSSCRAVYVAAAFPSFDSCYFHTDLTHPGVYIKNEGCARFSHCDFDSCKYGIFAKYRSATWVYDCNFWGYAYGIRTDGSQASLTVNKCDFRSGVTANHGLYIYLDDAYCLINGTYINGRTSSKKGIFIVGGGMIDIINCTIDSFTQGNSLFAQNADVNIINSIFCNAKTGIYYSTRIRAEGLVISNMSMVDTTNCYNPFSFYTFNPELDADKIAQADSAKIIGVNEAYGLEAPRKDDLGHCFRDGGVTPAIGWRSPYTETECESCTCPTLKKKIYFPRK